MSPAPGNAKRRRAFGWGLRAETVAALWLTAKGYRILARRYLARGGELDLVAARGAAVAFVEVKARGDAEAGFAALTAAKRRRMSIAARRWLAENPWAAGQVLRGDLLVVRRWRRPLHFEAAFALDI